MAEPRLEVRRAVRAVLAEVGSAAPNHQTAPVVLVACSGGADSLALAAALAAEAPRAGVVAGGVVVDHGLQAGSAGRARTVGAVLARWGLDPVEVIHVRVGPGPGGPEGRARGARYAVLDAAAERHQAMGVLLGHTMDDQAETVLLGLARGAGARSLGGMAPRHGRYRRPLLRMAREVVRAAIPDEVDPWEDPHNADPAFTRSRVRHQVLPILEKELGPGVAAALARTGELLRADADVLDELAHQVRIDVTRPGGGLDVGELAGLPRAVRWRVLRAAAIDAGCPPTDLTAAHIEAVDALVTAWRGQKGIDLPGAIRIRRRTSRLVFEPSG
ncbi:tRNA lysidine(34) synthetase TilS [Phytoactinopolyspora limicola]|uniref:tRNA lysidine(34) synthetase TilS n=1 Tax=Phytoactinopolyspora limicola TaxID=2715536 RepID=UPI00140819BC|nr:tRNA lysidine(34) synthetase TilS [Phytoactinopolyspora limicola]